MHYPIAFLFLLCILSMSQQTITAQTIEEQLEIAKEKITNAQESGAYGPVLGSVSIQIQNITYHNCDLPITNVGLIDTGASNILTSIFSGGVQIMGNVHNNLTHLIEGVGVAVELYNEANSLIGVETGQTEPSSIQPGDYSPFKIRSTAKLNTNMTGSMVFGCSYSIYDPLNELDNFTRSE
jgi:hypothetical protein